jgi:hypothetical protein
MRRFPITRAYKDQNPIFELAKQSRPGNLSKGQRTMIFQCLEELGSLSLKELAQACHKKNYELTFRNPKTDIRDSILYHLNAISSVREKTN